MAALSKILCIVTGAVLGSEALWQLVCLWRQRLKRHSAEGEIVEVLFFPDLPADLFLAANSSNSKEELVCNNMSKEWLAF